jgi:hypothetical protein
VGARLECGVGVDRYNDWQEGNIIFDFNKVAKSCTFYAIVITVVTKNNNRQ